MDDVFSTILNTDTKELLKTRDAELHKVFNLKFILNEVRSLDQEESDEIKRALRLLTVADYIRMGVEKVILLDLQDCGRCPQLNYIDCKVLHNKLIINLQRTLKPIAELCDKIRKELPDALCSDMDKVELGAQQAGILRLQEKHSECLEKLVEMRKHNCALMMKVADIKMGPYLVNELKLQKSKAQLLEQKSDLLRTFFMHDIFTRTRYSLKAHKMVDANLDKLISAKEH